MSEVIETPFLKESVAPEVTVETVKRMVLATGPCDNLDCLRPREEPLDGLLKIYEVSEEEKAQILADLEKKAEPVLFAIKDLFENEDFLKKLAGKPEKEKITSEEVRLILGADVELRFVKRILLILNHCFDPEVIPAIFELMVKQTENHLESSVKEIENIGLPEQYRDRRKRLIEDRESWVSLEGVSQALSENEELRDKWTDLFTDEQFINEFFLLRPGVSYSQEMAKRVEAVIETTISQFKETNKEAKVERMMAIRSGLENFFNSKGEEWTASGKTGSDFIEKISKLTGALYFERRFKDYIYPEKDRWMSGIPFPNVFPIDYLRDYAIAVERGKYLLRLYLVVKDILERFCPEVFIPPEVEKLEWRDPYIRGSSSKPRESCELTNGHYNKGDNLIGIESGTLVSGSTEEKVEAEETFHFGEKKMPRKITDVSVMAHEITHAFYQRLVRARLPENHAQIGVDRGTADHAISEGFSVLMELIFADLLISNPGLLRLSIDDARRLEQCKEERFLRLRRERNGYTEGTFWILHRIYKEGAGLVSKRDMSSGLKKVRKFLDGLDPKKTLEVKRDSPEYMQLVRNTSPDALKAMFS